MTYIFIFVYVFGTDLMQCRNHLKCNHLRVQVQLLASVSETTCKCSAQESIYKPCNSVLFKIHKFHVCQPLVQAVSAQLTNPNDKHVA